MKIGAISGDLAVKLGLVAVAGLGAWWLLRRYGDKFNPLSPENAAYSGVNALGSQVITSPTGPGKNADGSWSLGGFLFDVLNPGTAAAVQGLSGPVSQPEPLIDYSTYAGGA